MLKTIRKHGVTLALFAAGLAGLTAAINRLAKSAVDGQTAIQQKTLFDQVSPGDRYNNNSSESYYLVDTPALGKGMYRVYITRQDGCPVAAILKVTAPDGYSGVIQLLVGVDFTDTVLGTWVTECYEMPGLDGEAELRLSDQITHLSGKTIAAGNDSHWATKKNSGDSGQFTGATITSHVVINVVKHAGLYAQTLPA